MKIKLTIAELATLLENYKKTKLIDNKEILISDLNIKIPTPLGLTTIDAFIKKENLPILTVSLSNGYTFKAAKKHLVQSNKVDVYLEDLKIGDKIDHQHLDSVIVTSIEESLPQDCFDVAIESPHTYYDANGVIHHNTIVTATLAKVCEKYGRTITIVPNKSLVEQTEEDFVNVGLDVGVYYGDRKDIGKTHTIATWQSLNILEKKSKDDDSLDGLAEFLDQVNCVIVDECFDGNTLIQTPKGKIPIKNLKEGDKVINLCEKTNQYKEDTVIRVHKNLPNSQNEKMLELIFDNGQIIKVTANHKFLTNKGWVRADEISNDLEIININTYS